LIKFCQEKGHIIFQRSRKKPFKKINLENLGTGEPTYFKKINVIVKMVKVADSR